MGQIYTVELEIKTRQRETLLLPTYVYYEGGATSHFYENRDDFNFHITNSQFLSSNIRPLMASSSRSLYDMPGLAPRIDVLF